MTIQAPIFGQYTFGEAEREAMDRDGHFAFPELLTPLARERLTESLAFIESIRPNAAEGHEPNRFSAEFNSYLESLIGHPQMLALARKVLGEEIRYDHCVALNRPGGNQGSRWHSHGYGEEDPNLGFIRIFFYVNGFEADDGGLKVVLGSHLFRDREIRAPSDEELKSGWMAGKTHPMTGEPLQIERLSVPSGTVILMWTHEAHGVNPRQDDSEMRWTVVYAYRNPGLPSRARWISEVYEKKVIPGAGGCCVCISEEQLYADCAGRSSLEALRNRESREALDAYLVEMGREIETQEGIRDRLRRGYVHIST